MIEIRRILCPTDLSEISHRALVHAAALAGWYEAEIEVLHVVQQLLPYAGGIPSYPSWMALNPAAREQLAGELRRFAAPATEEGVPVSFDIREGDAVQEILDEARTLPADLVLMGTHGRGGFQRWILGSVTEKTLRKAPCPVMTVPPLAEGMPAGPVLSKRILCPVDFSEASLNALRYALSLAQEARADLTVLHVVEWLVEDEPWARPPVFDVPEFRRRLEGEARERLRAIIPAEARNWCRPEEVLGAGKAYREILRLAHEREAQLIVMGVRGRSPVDLMLFGSTTHHVIRGATCPVLAIHSD